MSPEHLSQPERKKAPSEDGILLEITKLLSSLEDEIRKKQEENGVKPNLVPGHFTYKTSGGMDGLGRNVLYLSVLQEVQDSDKLLGLSKITQADFYRLLCSDLCNQLNQIFPEYPWSELIKIDIVKLNTNNPRETEGRLLITLPE